MNTNILQRIALVTLIIPLLLAACAPWGGQKKINDMALLYDGNWHLVAYGNDEGISIVMPGLRTSVNFQEDGEISGNAGCNNFFGTFEAKRDGSFSVDEPLGATLMFCTSFMDEESAFLAALQSAEFIFYNDKGQLVIEFGASDDGYTFMVLVNQENVPLVGTGWVLGSLVTSEGEITIPPATAPLLSFSEDGSLSGSGGCNRIMSEFTTEDDTISISEFASSMMYCDGLMEVEDHFIAGLEQASRFEIIGDRLVLSDDAMINVLTFFAADFELTETRWQLQVFNGENIPEELAVTLTLSSDGNEGEGIVFGSTGCNRFSGTYTMDEDQLNINVLVVTVIMCDFGMETETAFLEALRDQLTYQIEFNRLVLVSENNALVFLGEKPGVGGLWRVSTLGDPQNPVEVTFDQTILAEFIQEEGANTGLLSGSTPCQEYSARFFVDRNFITTGMPEIKDLGQCQDDSALDSQYFEALQKVETFEFYRGGLILRDADGNQVLAFAQQ